MRDDGRTRQSRNNTTEILNRFIKILQFNVVYHFKISHLVKIESLKNLPSGAKAQADFASMRHDWSRALTLLDSLLSFPQPV